MMYKFKSQEAMNLFVENSPYTSDHNLIMAGLIGFSEFKLSWRKSIILPNQISDTYWVSIGGQEFVITNEEMGYFEKIS